MGVRKASAFSTALFTSFENPIQKFEFPQNRIERKINVYYKHFAKIINIYVYRKIYKQS